MNHFLALTAPIPIIFLSNFSIADEAALVTDIRKRFFAKEAARSNDDFFA